MAANDRRPIPATRSTALPSLVDVTGQREPGISQPLVVVGVTGAALAAGMVLLTPYDPVCGPTRASELNAHGTTVANDLRQGRMLHALAQMGMALGFRAHPPLEVPAMGEPGVVSPVPLPSTVVPPPEMRMPMGAPRPMTVVPPEHHTGRHHDRVTHAAPVPVNSDRDPQ